MGLSLGSACGLDAWPSAPHDVYGADVDFLVELTHRTGCALRVDVNNLYVNARNVQFAGLPGDPLAHCQAWLDAVSAAWVGEIHLAGHVVLTDGRGGGPVCARRRHQSA